MSHPGIEFNSDKILLSQNQRGKNVTRQSISQLSYSKLLKFQFSISNLPSDIHFSSAESIVECIGFFFLSNIWFCHLQTSHHSWTFNPASISWSQFKLLWLLISILLSSLYPSISPQQRIQRIQHHSKDLSQICRVSDSLKWDSLEHVLGIFSFKVYTQCIPACNRCKHA